MLSGVLLDSSRTGLGLAVGGNLTTPTAVGSGGEMTAAIRTNTTVLAYICRTQHFPTGPVPVGRSLCWRLPIALKGVTVVATIRPFDLGLDGGAAAVSVLDLKSGK